MHIFSKRIIPIVLIFILLLGNTAIFANTNSTANQSRMVSQLSYETSNSSYKILYNGQSTSLYGYCENGNVYIPTTIIEKYCSNNGITVDSSSKKILIDLSKQNIMMADEEVTNFVKENAGTVYVPLKSFNNTLCFPINVLEQFLKLSYTVTNSTIKLFTYSATDKIAYVTEATAAIPTFSSNNVGAFILPKNAKVYIEGETKNYYKISTSDNIKCYVMKCDIDIEEINLSSVDFYAPKQSKFVQSKDQKINLVWQYVSTVPVTPPSETDGIDVAAPVWFKLKVGDGGNVSNIGDKGYCDNCHNNGFLVWATITNNFSEKGSTAFTTEMFNTPEIQNKAIAQYLFYSCLYGVDGINIDFEDVKDSDRDGLTKFTQTFRNYTEKQGLNLSIDVLIPKPWTIEYDRAALSKYVDYIAVMSYDEHYSGSEEAGSISSLPFAESAVSDCLSEGVPKEKLLMGVPLYTRIWVIDSNGKKVSNPSATMTKVDDIISQYGLTKTYLTKEKQNYVEYKVTEGTAKIWIEDETSINNRLDLVHKYDIAGTSCWQYSQGKNSIWNLFSKSLK